MGKKKSRIQIKDLNVNLDELKKIRPEVLAKIRGGTACTIRTSFINPCPVSSGCNDMFLVEHADTIYKVQCVFVKSLL